MNLQTENFILADYLKQEKDIIEQELNDVMPAENTHPAILHTAMRYAVFTGGKRIRPILCKAACKAICGNSSPTVPAALALEILHTYTLVHDDLPSMDDDTVRRGQPTVHVKFGEANAILVGDALQALAFELITKSPIPAKQTVQLIKELALAAGSCGVIGGQVEDLAASGIADIERIDWIHFHKTAYLFLASVRMGAIAAGADENQLKSLTEYGKKLGLAFQIADDILDAPDEKQKHPEELETTYLAVYSIAEAKQIAEKYITEAIDALKQLPEENIIPLISIAEFVISRTI